MTTRARLTAPQEILLAAADLLAEGGEEFTEWDLTVAVWQRDQNKFGCRGYEDSYPDHKRVMMEIMSRKKRDNPLRRGWIEKTRPNHYMITPLGMAEARRLSSLLGETAVSVRSGADVYDAIVGYIRHRVFAAHCRDPEEPSTWLGAEAFLGIAKNDPIHVADRIRTVENAIQQARSWFEDTGEDVLRRGAAGSGITIRSQDVNKLSEFLSVLQDRFKRQFEAIRRQRV